MYPEHCLKKTVSRTADFVVEMVEMCDPGGQSQLKGAKLSQIWCKIEILVEEIGRMVERKKRDYAMIKRWFNGCSDT